MPISYLIVNHICNKCDYIPESKETQTHRRTDTTFGIDCVETSNNMAITSNDMIAFHLESMFTVDNLC